jgi:hypothetical protein
MFRPVASLPKGDPLTAKANAVISAAPKMRNLQKELTNMVPTNVLRHSRPPTTALRGGASMGHPDDHEEIVQERVPIRKRMVVDAAPDPEVGVPQRVHVPHPTASVSSPPSSKKVTDTPKPKDDEYSQFLKEMQGLI